MKILWAPLFVLASLATACSGGASGSSSGASGSNGGGSEGGAGTDTTVAEGGTSSDKDAGTSCAFPTPEVSGALTDAEAAKLFATPPTSSNDAARTGLFQSGAIRIRIAEGYIQFGMKRADGSAWGVKSNIGGWSQGANDSGTFVVFDSATNVDSKVCTDKERSMSLAAGDATFYGKGSPGKYTLRVPFASLDRVCCARGSDFSTSDLDVTRLGD